MSVGNQTQAIDFDKGELTLVLGENLDLGGDGSGSRNGTGKTTIVNALSYAIYGNALTNIKRDNLINKINGKGMLVSIDFEKDGIQYTHVSPSLASPSNSPIIAFRTGRASFSVGFSRPLFIGRLSSDVENI